MITQPSSPSSVSSALTGIVSLLDSEPDGPLQESEYKLQDPGTIRTRTHPRYSFSDDRLSFTVGDVDYTIHAHLLATHAPRWLDELTHMARPIVLRGVQTHEMDALLSILYPSDVCGWDISSVEDWRSVLRLASRWHFQSVRKLAIKHLDGAASAPEKVVLAREFDVSAWLLPSFVSLCTRPDPLKLREAENMSTADIILVTTTRELTKTGQLRADADTVSRHVQRLLDPEPASDIPEDAVRQEDKSNAGGSPEPFVNLTSQAAMSTAAAYEPEILTQALNEKDYDKAVAAMTGDDHEDIARRMDAWPSGSSTDSVQDLSWAIIRGCARDGDFIPSAVRIFCAWKQATSRHSGTIEEVLRDASKYGILPAPLEQASFDPSSAHGGALYAPYERWLSGSEYALRCRNARRFVAELVRSGMLDLTETCDSLPAHCSQGGVLYECLLVLGPLLDVPNVKENLDQRLSYCDRSGSGMNYRVQMQKILLLRKRGWVPEDE